MADPEREVTGLLQRLIQANTVNPPGRERHAQEELADYLTDAGIAVELLGATAERPNLIARLPGREPGPTLCFLAHMDTVLADASEWRQDPWSGAIAEGCIWGRGAIDMKSQLAAEAVAMASLARSGWRPQRGSLLLVSVVDEETGGEMGASWLTREHPELVRCDLLLNEGAGSPFDLEGRRHYGVCCGEKGAFRLDLTAHGVAGHASQPTIGDNALVKLAPMIERLGRRQPSYAMTWLAAAFAAGIGADPADPSEVVRRLAAEDPKLAAILGPMFGVTLAPTRVAASEKINVIPSRAVLGVDARVPPGLGESEVRAAVAELLGEDSYELAFTERLPGNASPDNGVLREAIDEWIAENAPGAVTVPMMMPGFTDSRFFRDAFPECVAYGFFPHAHQTLTETAPLLHGRDERIDVRDLAFATRFYVDVARRLLGR
ncbi:MAG: M20/M25/M40 family metallo-hydrolase [Solirubrobacterales bacterium]